MKATSPYTKSIIYALLILVACVIFYPGLSGPFLFDDILNIVDNKSLQISEIGLNELIQAIFSYSAGPLGRPIANLTFAFNIYFFGINPFSFKIVNLLIHFLNITAVFVLTRQLLSNSLLTKKTTPEYNFYFALFVAAIWGLNPSAIDNVLYVVQRMNLLSSFFILWGCVFYLNIRKRSINYSTANTITRILLLILFTAAAALSKENGLLLPAFILAIELFVFRFQFENKKQKYFAYSTCTLLAIIPGIIAAIYLFLNPSFITHSYSYRSFDLIQRLLSEPRILFHYIHGQFSPISSSLGIFHDDISVSTNLFQPISTFLSIGAILTAIVLGLLSRRKYPFIIFGIAWFVFGHIMESTAFALELYFLHRNYLPSLGLFIIFAAALTTVFSKSQQKTITAIAASYLAILLLFSFIRANIWSSEYSLLSDSAYNHPKSARANYELGNWYIKNVNFIANPAALKDAEQYFIQSVNSGQHSISGHYGLILLNTTTPIENLNTYITNMEYRLRAGTFKGNNIDFLQELSRCIIDGICILPANTADNLYSAALDNITASKRARAVLESDYAGFILNYHKDYKKALLWFHRAVNTDRENFSIHDQLIRLLAVTGNFESASKALEMLGQSPNAFKHHHLLKNLELFITRTSRDKNTTPR